MEILAILVNFLVDPTVHVCMLASCIVEVDTCDKQDIVHVCTLQGVSTPLPVCGTPLPLPLHSNFSSIELLPVLYDYL